MRNNNAVMTIHPTIQRKISLLQEYLTQFEPYAALDTALIVSNPEKQAAMERVFMLMVDMAAEIAGALSYQLGGKVAETNRSTFLELVPLGIVSEPFAVRISESVRIRNDLMHRYEGMQKMVAVEAMKRFTEIYREYALLLIKKFVSSKKVE